MMGQYIKNIHHHTFRARLCERCTATRRTQGTTTPTFLSTEPPNKTGVKVTGSCSTVDDAID
jgi:hypothetical protein